MTADHDVFKNRHLAGEANVLEGPCHAELADLVRALLAYGLASEDHVTLCGCVKAAQDVEQRRLAGTVGTNDTADAALWQGNVHFVHCHDAAKTHGDILCRKQGVRGTGNSKAHYPSLPAVLVVRRRKNLPIPSMVISLEPMMPSLR